MKKAYCIFLAFILIFSLSFTSFAANSVKIDGKMSNTEWSGSDSLTIYTERSNTSNEVSHATVKTKFDKDNFVLYFGFSFQVDNAPREGSENIGIILEIDGSESFKIDFSNATPTTKVNASNNSNVKTYENVVAKSSAKTSAGSLEGALMWEEESCIANCEIKYASKKALPENVSFSVSFVDADGEESSHKMLSAANPNLTTTQVIGTTTKAEKTTKEKTTKEKTTKSTTSKETTTVAKTHRVDAKKNSTTKATTTKATTVKTTAAKVTEKVTSAEAKTEKTTKEKTTKEKTTKAKTTKTAKTTTKKSTTIYYYEKEVIISEVSAEAGEADSNGSAFNVKSVKRSTLYKILTGIGAAVLFGVIGIWAVKSKGSDEKEKEEPKEE